MQQRMRQRLLGLWSIAALSLGASAMATEQMPLPEAPLTAVDGRSMTTAQLVRPGKWLLIYIQPNCPPCETLLRLVKKSEHPSMPSRLAIVVGATRPAALRQGAAQFPDLDGAGWYADPNRGVLAPLELTGAPVVLGLNRDVIEWRLSGVLSNADEVKSILASWVEKPQ